MSLNEVNWRRVFTDNKSFPPELEFLVTNKDSVSSNSSSTVLQQKFLCHRLLLAAASPVFQTQFFSEGVGMVTERLVVVINDCNTAAFEKMLEFIYYLKPYKLNNTRQVVNMEGINLIMDTMALAVEFNLGKLASFCEETVRKVVMVTSQNYKEVQMLILAHKEFGQIHRDFCEKFRSIVHTKLSRDQLDMDPAKKREVVEQEVEIFRRGLSSKVMDGKRHSALTASSYDSSQEEG